MSLRALRTNAGVAGMASKTSWMAGRTRSCADARRWGSGVSGACEGLEMRVLVVVEANGMGDTVEDAAGNA